MGFWNYFVGEVYCLYNACKDKEMKICETHSVEEFFEKLEEKKRIKWKTIRNTSYINKKPFCKNPGRMTRKKVYSCIDGEKGKLCPFFGYVLSDREEFEGAVKAIEKSYTKKDRKKKKS